MKVNNISRKLALYSDGESHGFETGLALSFFERTGERQGYSLEFHLPEGLSREYCSKHFLLYERDFERIARLLKLTEENSKKILLFEPVEPCFSFKVEPLEEADRYRFEFWLDVGYFAPEGFACWDALGLRFQCSRASLSAFFASFAW